MAAPCRKSANFDDKEPYQKAEARDMVAELRQDRDAWRAQAERPAGKLVL